MSYSTASPQDLTFSTRIPREEKSQIGDVNHKKKKSTNIHHKISVHFERPLVQRFSEKTRVLFFGRYMDYLEFPFATRSRIKWWRMSMCFELGVVAGFLAR